MRMEAERLAARWQKQRLLAEDRRTRAQDFARKLAKDFGLADPGIRAILGFGSAFESWRQFRLDSEIWPCAAVTGAGYGL
jgi:hypothetical protein